MIFSDAGGYKVITGQVKYMSGRYYVVVNEKGTMERLTPPHWSRVLLWHFVHVFRPFRSVEETKRFLRVEKLPKMRRYRRG